MLGGGVVVVVVGGGVGVGGGGCLSSLPHDSVSQGRICVGSWYAKLR